MKTAEPSLLWQEYQRLCDCGLHVSRIIGVFPPSGPDGARFEFEDGTSSSFLFPAGYDSCASWEIFGKRAGQAFLDDLVG